MSEFPIFQKCDIDTFSIKKRKKKDWDILSIKTPRENKECGKKLHTVFCGKKIYFFQSVQKSKTLYGWDDNKNSLCAWKHPYQNWTHARENGIVGNVGLEMRNVHSCQWDIVSPKLHAPPAQSTRVPDVNRAGREERPFPAILWLHLAKYSHRSSQNRRKILLKGRHHARTNARRFWLCYN